MNIIIIEDDIDFWNLLKKKLINVWFSVKLHHNKKSFLFKSYKKTDLYIIDLILWDSLSWYEIIRYLREEKKDKTPIIITSWLEKVENKIYWLNIWADDYLAKPFSPNELIARINAIIRRNHNTPLNSIIKYNKNIYYNSEKHKIYKNWDEITFTPREKQIIKLFIMNKWKIISKNKLVEDIWWEHEDGLITDNTINVTFFHIRKKIWNEFKLNTLHWIWYILE